MQIVVMVDGKPKGPFELEALKEAVQKGEVSTTALAWYEGCAEWIPLMNIPGLMPSKVNSLPPPIPASAEIFHAPEKAGFLPKTRKDRIVAVLVGVPVLLVLCATFYLSPVGGLIFLSFCLAVFFVSDWFKPKSQYGRRHIVGGWFMLFLSVPMGLFFLLAGWDSKTLYFMGVAVVTFGKGIDLIKKGRGRLKPL